MMYTYQNHYYVRNNDKQSPSIALMFTLVFLTTVTNGEYDCTDNGAGPFIDAQKLENKEGWQEWKDYMDSIFYINHKKKQIQSSRPTSSPSEKVIEDQRPYPESLDDKILLLRENLEKKDDVPSEYFSFVVERNNILQDSYNELTKEGARNNFKRVLDVKFTGEEEADDSLQREAIASEWFWLLSSEIFNPQNNFFRYADERNCQIEINPDFKDIEKLKFIGRVVGVAMYHRNFINVEFVKPYYRIMLGEPILSQDAEITNLTHSDDNTIYEKNVTSVQDQMCAFLEGFAEFMPLPYIRIFTADELQLVISGEETIEIEDWEKNTDEFFNDDDKKLNVVQWFWNIVHGFTDKERKQLLEFVTGSPRLPNTGFYGLYPKFTIVVEDEFDFVVEEKYETIVEENNLKGKIPIVDLGYNCIKLLNYSGEDIMRDKIKKAIETPHLYRHPIIKPHY